MKEGVNDSNSMSLVAVPHISGLPLPIAGVALRFEVEGAVGGVEEPGPPLQDLLPNSELGPEKNNFIHSRPASFCVDYALLVDRRPVPLPPRGCCRRPPSLMRQHNWRPANLDVQDVAS